MIEYITQKWQLNQPKHLHQSYSRKDSKED